MAIVTIKDIENHYNTQLMVVHSLKYRESSEKNDYVILDENKKIIGLKITRSVNSNHVLISKINTLKYLIAGNKIKDITPISSLINHSKFSIILPPTLHPNYK